VRDSQRRQGIGNERRRHVTARAWQLHREWRVKADPSPAVIIPLVLFADVQSEGRVFCTVRRCRRGMAGSHFLGGSTRNPWRCFPAQWEGSRGQTGEQHSAGVQQRVGSCFPVRASCRFSATREVCWTDSCWSDGIGPTFMIQGSGSLLPQAFTQTVDCVRDAGPAV
jgi:hypothetical protein